MARKKDVLKVGTITADVNDLTVDIFLDLKEHNFFAIFDGETHEDPEYNSLHDSLVSLMRGKQRLNWVPVIHVETTPGLKRDSFHSLGLRVERYYATEVPYSDCGSNIWLCKWETKEEDRQRNMTPTYSLTSMNLPRHHNGSHWIPYDETIWNSLHGTLLRVDEAEKDLERHIENDILDIVQRGDSLTVLTLIAKKQL